MNQPDFAGRIRGALLGTLVGDAIGVPVEFSGRSMRDRDPVIGMRGFGTWNQPPGTWSDDGALALVTADTLATEGWDPVGMMAGFCRWLDEGLWSAHGEVFDVGATTRNALINYRILADLADCGQTDERSNGNGSLMRCLPVSLWLIGEPVSDRVRMAGEASALTHAHLRSRLCCAWHALWCEATMGNGDIRTAAAKASARLHRDVPAEERKHLARILDGSAMDLPRERVPSDGYVISTLEASLWCLANHGSFRDAVLAAVNLGGDTDTTGAVVGGMAGWLYGVQSIPAEWLEMLPRQVAITDLADQFAVRCLDHWSSHAQS